MKFIRSATLFSLAGFSLGAFFYSRHLTAQTSAATVPPNRTAHVLVIAQTKGFEHDSIPDAMASVWKMGHDTKLWETYLRTDTELITKHPTPDQKRRNMKDLNYFDALVFASPTGELDLTDQQKQDMMSFIKEDGKGFVGIHAALDTNFQWPEYGEMIGGWFDQHPWMTFEAPIINEDPSFPLSATFRTNS